MTVTVSAMGPVKVNPIGGFWALLVGIGLLMLGNGLQSILLGVRSEAASFSSTATGLIMAAYFLGYLVGSIWAPKPIRRVGHIRVFAALASMASITGLLHYLYVDPVVWGVLRFITGLCFAGIFIASESWLNDSVDNEHRGSMLSVYMLTGYAGLAGGQMLVNTGDLYSAELFILVSVLVSMAVVPLLLSASRVPAVPEFSVEVSVRRLFHASPLGVVGTLGAGLLTGIVLGMGAVYGASIGLEVHQVALFMGALMVGAALLQWPIGRLSDLIDRRIVITGVCFASGALALALHEVVGENFTLVLGVAALFGAASLCLYSLSVAYTNDYLEPAELVGASSTLMVIYSVGSVIGPVLTGFVMDFVGPEGFLFALITISFLLGGFALWRMTQLGSLSEDQGPYMAIAPAASTVVIETVEELHQEEVHASDSSWEPDDVEVEARRYDTPEQDQEEGEQAA